VHHDVSLWFSETCTDVSVVHTGGWSITTSNLNMVEYDCYQRYVYWSDLGQNTIGRCLIDGTSFDNNYISGGYLEFVCNCVSVCVSVCGYVSVCVCVFPYV